MSVTNRAIRNGGIFSFIIAAIGLYQGESLLTSAMVWGFAWVVMSGAFWVSYRITQPKNQAEPESIMNASSEEQNHQKEK
ncbi:MAG: hypothetical protein U9N57_12075 [Pseudomonadota bacterium]|nr:hypothetical protein [Pseudomonadota bacterium]